MPLLEETKSYVKQRRNSEGAPERRTRRSLVLCFDGTGLKFRGTPEDSNILKIYSLLDHQDINQFSYYQPGIGTYIEHQSLRATSRYARIRSWWTKSKDQMVGTSFDDHVMAGYKFLMKFYLQDDDIYMFGFSRGAYTARFLAEMLDYIGLLQAGNEEMIQFAWKTFSNWQRRHEGEKHHAKNEAAYEFMKKFRETFSRPIRPIRFLGLLDTVNSVPMFEVAWMQRAKYPYTSRTSAKIIRHAVSINERRSKFRQDLIADKGKVHEKQHHFREWARDLRSKHHGVANASEQADMVNEKDDDSTCSLTQHSSRFRSTSRNGRRTNKDLEFDEEEHSGEKSGVKDKQESIRAEEQDDDEDDDAQDIQEVWFAGDHGDVGGGWDIMQTESPHPASHIPLLWMIREGLRAGVPFDVNKLHANNFFPHEYTPSHQHTHVNASSPPQKQNEELRDTFFTAVREAEASRVHDAIKFGDSFPFGAVLAWNFLEYLPFRRMDLQLDGSWRPLRWPLPMGETRDMPDTAVVHGSAIRRMKANEKFRPGNLIIGGGGRVKKVAPPEYGIGKWRCVREEGDLLGECWVRDL